MKYIKSNSLDCYKTRRNMEYSGYAKITKDIHERGETPAFTSS